jgi:RNA polymerase sigma factor (sigma-70 family)
MDLVAPLPADRRTGDAARADHLVLAGVYRDKAEVLSRMAVGLVRDPGVADDLVQEAFIRTLRARGAPDQPDELFFYLVRVVLNLTRSHAAKAARRATRRSPHRIDDTTPGPTDGAGGAALAEAVARLSRRQREVVFLRYWLDLGVDQTAASLGISAGSVKTHAARALEHLRAELADRDELTPLEEEDRP